MRRLSFDGAAESFDLLAQSVQQLATFLSAGLGPLASLRALDEAAEPFALAAQCASATEVPEVFVKYAPKGLAGLALGYLAACWAVAVASGGALAATLDRVTATLRAFADAERAVQVALTGPVATARIVAFLPLLGLAMGMLIGANPLTVIVSSVPGALSAVAGIVLLVAGVRWNRRLIAEAMRHDLLAGWGCDLLALALASGLSPERGFALVQDAVSRSRVAISLDEMRGVVGTATRVGVPVSALLRAEGERLRRVAVNETLRRAAALGTKLLAPLALCFLPAFLCLGVFPLILGIIRDTLIFW